ncbi:MAG: chemotaxis protein CheX [Campylobacterales bacterium]|nr:chemotaxis protein CheX [Campylobacterales bacterium]
MRAIIKNGIGVFHPQGFLDGDAAESMLSIDDIKATENSEASMILVSLKKVIFFNKNGLETFVRMLKKVHKSNNAIVGFCDYDIKKFNSIINFFQNELSFSLFKTYEIASLFAQNYDKQNKNVLVYSDDKSQRAAMAIELHNNGHNPIIAQSKAEFKEKSAKKDTYDMIIEDSYIGQMDSNISSRVTGNAIIYTLSSYLDADTTNKFNIAYHTNSLKIGFRLFIFECYTVKSMNIHALNFFSKIATYAAEYNATICFVGMTYEKTPIKFKETLEDCGIMFFERLDDILEDKELLHELGASKAVAGKDKKGLNKALVSELPKYIDATVATINMMTNAKATKESAQIQTIDIKDKDDKLASSIGFYGDLEGMIMLAFPKKIAKKACEVLIGEETDDIELILDALAEFVNIIGGKVKSLLSNENIKVKITLPRTYENVDELLEVAQDKKGVQVDLSFEDDKFLFFLTR